MEGTKPFLGPFFKSRIIPYWILRWLLSDQSKPLDDFIILLCVIHAPPCPCCLFSFLSPHTFPLLLMPSPSPKYFSPIFLFFPLSSSSPSSLSLHFLPPPSLHPILVFFTYVTNCIFRYSMRGCPPFMVDLNLPSHQTTFVLQGAHGEARIVEHPWRSTYSGASMAEHSLQSTHGGAPMVEHPRQSIHVGASTVEDPGQSTHVRAPTVEHPWWSTHGRAPRTEHPCQNTHSGAPMRSMGS